MAERFLCAKGLAWRQHTCKRQSDCVVSPNAGGKVKCMRRMRNGAMKMAMLTAGRVLPFHPGRTQACAELTAKARTSGLVIASSDGYIAAVAANDLAVATRDTGPFKASSVAAINPWQP